MKRIIGCAAVLAAVAFTVNAADDVKAEKSGAAEKALAPAEFVTKVAQSDLYELKSSEMALTQSASAEVKKFAEHMIADHGKTSKELTAAASQKGLTVPTGVSQMQADMLKRLGTLQGAAFDAEYIKQQTAAHEKAVALFRAQVKNGQDADLKAWAGKTLPALEDHLKHVKDLGSHDHGKTPTRETPTR